MSLFEDFKKNVTDFTENVAKKSSTVIETQKLKLQKSSLESDLRDCYIALGKLYEKVLADGYDEHCAQGRVMEKMRSVRNQMASIDEQLRQMKGTVCCPCCGCTISRDFDFCPKCGANVTKGSDPAASRENDEADMASKAEAADAVEIIINEEKDNED